jgi:2-polyprenyl-3-methyl-5-hydroxy-6-metoxy-1,4-benzoquinol methylase
MISSKKTADYAKERYNLSLEAYASKSEQTRVCKLVALVGSGNDVLDVGCYDGTLGEMLIKNGNRVWGIEASEVAAEAARKKGLQVKIGDIESGLEFEDNFFNVVIAGEIIEHLLDTDFFVAEIWRVLKPGGYLVLSTPNAASLGRRFMLFFGKNPYFEASLGFPPEARAGHIRFFTKDLLCSFLLHKGFRVVHFASDAVNLAFNQKMVSKKLADLFPTLGKSLIIKAQAQKTDYQ